MNGHIAIVGGGFSGTLLAINLLRAGGPTATLIEREGGRIARGVAYSAAHPTHLLNVRAGGMSAFPDQPAHFADWLAARGEGGAETFVPRRVYGDYLGETLAAARAAAPGRLQVIEGDACDVTDTGVMFADGRSIEATQVVLATGNLPPHPPGGIDPAALTGGRYLDDPWRADPAAGLGAGDTVVLIGTGLTAVDVALQLDAGGFAGQVIAMSRRGLRPRGHRDGLPAAAGETDLPNLALSDLVGQVRRRGIGQGWRAAVDALRPITQQLWATSDDRTRARFLRHLRPFWDVHRHRIAPAVAERVEAMVDAGRLRFVAGKIVSAMAEGTGVRLRWRPRHRDAVEALHAARIVNCTGPQGDLTRTDDPLLARLAARGAIRPDPLRLGIDVDPQSRVIAADGQADDRLLSIGPMTRGALWEVVAVPDLRRQAWDVAQRLSQGAADDGR